MVNSHKNKFDTDIVSEFLDQFGEERGLKRSIPYVSIQSSNKDDEDKEINNEDLKNELKEIKKNINYLRKQVSDLNKKLKELTNIKFIDELRDFGFKPITKEVLKKYSSQEIEKCEKIILDEIKGTNGDTDPDKIAKKYNLPLDLVAGSFSKLLEEGIIGEEDES